MSCDGQGTIPRIIANIVVVVVSMYVEHWLVCLPKVCNHELPVESLSVVDFASLVSVAYIIREL